MQPQSKVLKWSLIIGIVIVLNLFFNYALSLIYKQPTYEAFCPTQQVVTVPDNQKACVDAGGQWYDDNNMPVITGVNVTRKNFLPGQGSCNLQYTCSNNFNSAQRVYDRNVFITLVILGALCVFIANFFKSNLVVGIALSLSGVLSFVVASMRYWGSADDLIKVIILAIALGILIWVAVKRFKNNPQEGESLRP